MTVSSVCLYIVALRVGVGYLKLYRRLPSRTRHINFFRHFCCRVYRLSTIHSEKPNRRNFCGQSGHVTMAILISKRGIFGASVLELYRTSYAVRSVFLALATPHFLLVLLDAVTAWYASSRPSQRTDTGPKTTLVSWSHLGLNFIHYELYMGLLGTCLFHWHTEQ